MINAIIFSKDRASQLNLFLNSVEKNAKNIFELRIIYTYSDEIFGKGYDKLIKKYPEAKWFRQSSDFKQDVLTNLETNNNYTTFFTDDDIIYRAVNEEEMISKLEEYSVVGVWGKQIPIMHGKKISRRYMWSNFKDESQTNYFSEAENRYFFHNAFSFFKRDFMKKNQFDEKYAGKEDRYLAIDMINNGNTIVYDSNSVVNHFYTNNGATWKGIG